MSNAIKVRFIDSICGSGKTTAISNEINSGILFSENVIYASPFLTECERMKELCPGMGFYEPSDKGFGSKASDFKEGMKSKKNMVITHELLKNIKKGDFKNYHLILDEVIDTVTVFTELNKKDLKMALERKWLSVDSDGLVSINKDKEDRFDWTTHKNLKDLIKENKIFLIDDTILICDLSIDILKSFGSITIMSYMIEGSLLYNQLSNDSDFRTTKKQIDDNFNIIDYDRNLAIKRRKEYRNLITLADHSWNVKINGCCKGFSFTKQEKWSNETKTKISSIVRGFFRSKSSKQNETLYSAYSNNIKVRDYVNSYLSYNCRATNEHSKTHVLAYIVEKHNNQFIKRYVKDKYGFIVNEDLQALDPLIQWIFRSRIRNRQEITLLLPSRKMRDLLEAWANGEV